MSEHMFSHGPQESLGPAESEMLDRVAKAHGLVFLVYNRRANTLDQLWGFHGPRRPQGLAEQDLEDKVRAELDADPLFQAWCKRTNWTA